MAGATTAPAGLESSDPYFKEALVARLEATPALATRRTLIAWGNPHPKRWARETIIIGGTTDRTYRYVAAMTQANEEYDVGLFANFTGPLLNRNADNQRKAYELATAVEASLIEWTRAGGHLVDGPWGFVWAAVPNLSPSHDVEGIDKGGRDASVICTIRVKARLLSHGCT